MPPQESALYGDLVLHLRDRAAELLATEKGNFESQQERLDRIIRDWFFTPQDDLHGCAAPEFIWAEQKEELNPVYLEHIEDFFTDDCPVSQAELADIRAALEAAESPDWPWYHDDGGILWRLAMTLQAGTRAWLKRSFHATSGGTTSSQPHLAWTLLWPKCTRP